MRLIQDPKLNFDDVLLVPKWSELNSRSEVTLKRSFVGKHSGYKLDNCFPIVASNLDVLGVFSVARELAKFGAYTALHKFHSVETYVNASEFSKSCFYTLGINQSELEKYREVDKQLMLRKELPYNAYQQVIIDAPNGYIRKFTDFVKEFREDYPEHLLCVGNVVTPEMVEHLILNCGVDIVKIGIGGGGLCSTTGTTGVGYPMWSAVVECADAAHGVGGLIMADGGHKTTADIAKSFCAGADLVMLGSYFCGATECQGEWQAMDGKKLLKSYGMSSKQALEKYYGGVDPHRTSEGIVRWDEEKGPIKDLVHKIIGALNSTGTYIGASKIKDFSKCATFIRLK